MLRRGLERHSTTSDPAGIAGDELTTTPVVHDLQLVRLAPTEPEVLGMEGPSPLVAATAS
jgi:hypothetical protein